MGLLDPILTGVISDTRGHASADLVLQGQRREADLTGEIRVTGLSTRVDFTQVPLHHAPGGAERQGQPLPGFGTSRYSIPRATRGASTST